VSTTYAFIDGAAFEQSISEILSDFDCSLEKLNWNALTKNADRIFYFDALPVKKNSETETEFQEKLARKKEHFSKLRNVPYLHVREGISRSRRTSNSPELTQKGVDIALVTEVLIHAFSGEVDRIRLFANDLDFFPLLDALTNTRVKSELYYFKQNTAKELIEAADVTETLNHYTVHTAIPEPNRSTYAIAGHDEELSSYKPIRRGQNEFGEVTLIANLDKTKFVLNGKVDGTNIYSHMSKSEKLLICHFEACAKCLINW
jgi:uncharacterized LabA/DUF88 family protein